VVSLVSIHITKLLEHITAKSRDRTAMETPNMTEVEVVDDGEIYRLEVDPATMGT